MNPRTAATRRAFLASSAIAYAAMRAPASAAAPSLAGEASFEDLPSLGQRAPALPLFGLAASASRIGGARDFFKRMASEMALLTLEGDFQWTSMETRAGEWNFQTTDEGVAFAKAHDLAVAGHALYYHYCLPAWVRASSDREALASALAARIDKTVGRYRGSIFRWDVVNEPLNARDGLPGGLRQTSYSRVFGETFIDLAFRQARRSDPDALLCLNEADIEYDDQDAKRADLLALLRRLKERDAPVDVLGLQSHLTATRRLEPKALEAFLTNVAALGIKLAVTELDVLDEGLPSDPTVRDQLVADHAATYLRAVRNSGELVNLTCWGVSDRFTWLDMWHKRADGRPLRPLPFDFDLKRKPLWNVIREAVSA